MEPIDDQTLHPTLLSVFLYVHTVLFVFSKTKNLTSVEKQHAVATGIPIELQPCVLVKHTA